MAVRPWLGRGSRPRWRIFVLFFMIEGEGYLDLAEGERMDDHVREGVRGGARQGVFRQADWVRRLS